MIMETTYTIAPSAQQLLNDQGVRRVTARMNFQNVVKQEAEFAPGILEYSGQTRQRNSEHQLTFSI